MPNDILLIDNNGGGNCLYNAVSYHIYNNFNNQRKIRYQIANRWLQTAREMPMVTINNNLGENIPINVYANKVFIVGEWAGDAEISMKPLIFNDICVETYRLINDININAFLGYQFINLSIPMVI